MSVRQRPIILIIDDEITIIQILKSIISKYFPQYIVNSCSDPNTAIQYIENQSFDLVISDVNFHQTITGYDIARIIKERSPKTKIILISGYDEVKGFADLFLAKPFGYRDVLKAINETLPVN